MSKEQSVVDIVGAAADNQAFRRVVMTGKHGQVVVMTLPAGGEIGEETHPDTDQVLLFVDGRGEARLDDSVMTIGRNDLVLVRAGVRHNFVNTGNGPMRLVTIYAPPEHEPGTVHQTRAEADAAEH